MKQTIKFSVLSILLLASCASPNEDLLIGDWVGNSLWEEGKPIEINAQEIEFSFSDNGNYTYSSTLNYREAGSFYVESKYLFTTDTLNQATSEKVVEISLLSQDSLQLLMNEQGKTRLLKLLRKQL